MEQKEYNRYENSKIYKLIDPESGYYYIGSTCDKLSHRLNKHKHTSKKHFEQKVYKAFNELGWDNVKIILIQELYLDNKDQLLRAENEVIMAYIHDDKCLNSKKAWTGLDKKMYEKQYRIENKDSIKIYKKEYSILNRDSIKEYMKQYQETNKEIIREKRRIYGEENKEKIKTFKNNLDLCRCGSMCTHCNMKRHEKSKRHLLWLNDEKITGETI